jgi:hypothetical protein
MNDRERNMVISNAECYRCSHCGFGIKFKGVDRRQSDRQVGTAYSAAQVRI